MSSIHKAAIQSQSNAVVEGGYIPLGVDGDFSVIFSLRDKSVYRFGSKDFDPLTLAQRLGYGWVKSNYGERDKKSGKVSVDARKLAFDIIEDCQEAGPYSAKRELGRGVWLDQDGGLIVNGAMLWKPDGTVLEHGIHGNFVFPSKGSIGFDIQTPLATDDEVNEIKRALASLSWSNPLAPELVLGWFGTAVLSGALTRRAHLLITGSASCGKTTLMAFMRSLLDGACFACSGKQTEAGLSQALARRSWACLVDEMEQGYNRDGSNSVLEVARLSYSLSVEDSGRTRGTVSGVAMAFPVYSAFMGAGINPGSMSEADETRWTMLELQPLKEGSATQFSDERASELGPKLQRLLVSRWNVVRESLVTLRQVALDVGAHVRKAENLGILLACYWALVSDHPVTVDEAWSLLEKMGKETGAIEAKVPDEEQCLSVLMQRVMTFSVMQNDVIQRKQLNIGQALKLVAEQPCEQIDLVERLAQLGIRLRWVAGTWKVVVASSHTHPELKKVFKGSPWQHGGWSLLLRRLPGGVESTQRLGAGMSPAKVVMFDLPDYLRPEGQAESEMLLAA